MRQIRSVMVGLLVVGLLCGFSFPVAPAFFTSLRLQHVPLKPVSQMHLLTIQVEQSGKLLSSSV